MAEKKPDPRFETEQVNVRIDDELRIPLAREMARAEKAARCRLTMADFLRGLIVDGLAARADDK